LLEPLIETFPNAPLPRIHLCAALGLAGNFKEASKLYSGTLPISNAALIDCSERSPSTVSPLRGHRDRAEQRQLLEARPTGAADRDPARFDHEVVLQNAAVVDECLKDYSAARDKWTASIHVVKTAKPPDPNRLIEGYHAHARVSIKLAGIWQSDGTQQAMDAAELCTRGGRRPSNRAIP